MENEREYLKKVASFFLVITLTVGLGVTIVTSWQVGLIFGALIGLFMSFQLGRNLKIETFEINASNKDRMKGLAWYEEEIINHMRDMRYQLIVDEKDRKVWQPSIRARVMGGELSMEKTPYSITIAGPRGMVRILKSILDLNKIFI